MALNELGQEVVLVKYVGEAHAPLLTDTLRDSWQRALAFFDTQPKRETHAVRQLPGDMCLAL
ncbi:hypothetical protein [Rhodanobacter sp. KK11]|uniref:hypothetical protein n=1 Tax=Rhodanobacter sp. KK11 TaxID=3083255 RepID=UPI0029663048|nr:hypothetical protein [Rhodanobacter sp. KK11]MDW2980211.1 hypothetical protein [Rhodanobacter sp. KK11]